MRIVSNTSPLIILKKSGAIFILDELFDEVIIPKSVQKELFRKEKDFFSSLRFLKVVEPEDRNLVRVLKILVDEGEAEAMALAMELNTPLLIDDRKGRMISENLGLKYIGSLGLLKMAKNRKIIQKVKPFIERFMSEGYYLDRELVKKFLKDIGEE